MSSGVALCLIFGVHFTVFLRCAYTNIPFIYRVCTVYVPYINRIYTVVDSELIAER